MPHGVYPPPGFHHDDDYEEDHVYQEEHHNRQPQYAEHGRECSHREYHDQHQHQHHYHHHQQHRREYPQPREYDDAPYAHAEYQHAAYAAQYYGAPQQHYGYPPPEHLARHYLPYEFAPPPQQPRLDDQQRMDQRSEDEARRSVTPSSFEIVEDVTSLDVLCGRGAPNVHHAGNQFFRSVVKAKQPEYAALRRPDKNIVVRSILDAIEQRGGRFLRQLSNGDWIQVHDAIAYEKTCQALREFTKTRNSSRKQR